MRERRGWNISRAAEHLGLDVSNYRKLEKGLVDMRISTLARIVSAYRVSFEKFWRMRV